MIQNLTLNEEHTAYTAATDVQRTWNRVTGWTPPSKDPQIIKKWEYYKSLALLSEQALQAGDAK